MTPHKHIIALSNEFLTPTQEFMLPTREFIKNEYYPMITTHIKVNCLYDEPAHEILLDNLSMIISFTSSINSMPMGLLHSLMCRIMIFLDIWIWS